MEVRKFVVATLLLAMFLSGCTEEPPQPTEATQESQTEQTGQTQGTEPSETTEVTQPEETEPPITFPTAPLPDMEAVTKLRCTRWRTFPQLLDLGGGVVLASRNFYSSEKSAIINSMELVDVCQDTVLKSIKNDSTRQIVQQRFPDGCFVVADPGSNTFYVYDAALEVVDSFTAPNVDGFFSYDRKNYYYIANELLYRMDVASGNRVHMATEHTLHLEKLLSIHPNRNWVVAKFYLSPYRNDWGIGVLDLKSGDIKLLSDDYSHVWLNGDTFYGMRMSSEHYGYDVYYGSLSEGEIQRVSTDQLNLGRMNYTMLTGSDYLLCKAAADNDNGTALRNMADGTFRDLSDYGFTRSALNCIYLPDVKLIFGMYENGYDFDPIVLNPNAMELEGEVTPEPVENAEVVELSLAQSYESQLQGTTLPAALEQVRKQADELEDKYDITIWLGEQVTAPGEAARYTVQTVQTPEQIRQALETLEQALAAYPEGFFDQFRDGANGGGISFCLTGEMEGNLQPTGFATKRRSWYLVGLDITADGFASTIHHELWHTIEMKISADAFQTKTWTAANPDGFAYYGVYDEGYLDLTRYTYADGSGANSYFVDAYSRINGREDRARIWEEAMAVQSLALSESKALQNKLEIMWNALQGAFDVDDWKTLPWEA